MKKTITLILTLVTAAVFTTAVQAQTGVARWANGTITGSKRGMAYNPATDNLIVVVGGAPGSIKRIKASDGTSAGSDLTYPTGGSGTFYVAGIAVASDGTIYGCNYTGSGGTHRIYQWTSETATPTLLWSGTYLSTENGTVGANLAVYGTGNSTVLVLSTTGTGGLVVYYNGSAWTARAMTVVNQTLTSGLTFIDKDVAAPGQYRLMAKTGQTGGQIYAFDPTAGSGAISPTATAMGTTFAFAANGLHGIAYDPVTGLIGAITRVSSTSPFPGTNMLFNTGMKFDSGTLSKPAELWRANFTGNAGDGGAPGGAAWGKGAFFTSAANTGNNFFGWDVTAFMVSDITPASAIKNPGDSVTFSVVSGGSKLTYQWKKDGTAITDATTSSLTISPVSLAEVGTYTCTVSGVNGSSWTSGNGVLNLPQDTTTALTSSTATSTYGDAVTFTATISAASGTPTGNVTFKDGTTTLGTANLTAAGTADFTTNTLSVIGSPHTITATYNGDPGYNPSTSSASTQTVTPKTLVPSVTVGNKAYDGNLAAVIAGSSLEGIVNTDDVTLDGSGATVFPSKDVGSYTLTVTGLALSGTTAGNYVLSTDTVTAPASITPKALIVTSLTVDDKTYDRTTTATFTGSALLSGVVGTEDVSLSGSAATAFPSATVGTYNVTITGFSLLGADIANYTLAPLTQTAKITPKALTTDGVFANDKVYDGTLTNISLVFNFATLTGVIAPDDVTLAPASAIGYTTNKAIGSQFLQVTNFQLTGADAANYAVAEPYTTNVNVTVRTLNVSATAASKIYDGSDTAAVTLTSDQVVWDDVVVASSTAAFSDKNVGTAKAVTVTGVSISGADAANYALSTTPVTATADITPVVLSVTGVTALSKPYDGTTAATLGGTPALSAGVIAPDNVSLDSVTGPIVANFNTKNVGVGKPVTVTGFRLSGADAGNYTLAQPAPTADIAPVALSVLGLTALSKTYDGNATATLGGAAALSAGVVSGEDVNLAGTPSALFNNKNIGVGKPITVTGYTLAGADIANYTLAQPAGLAADITSVALSVVGVSANSKPYDGNATATLSGTAALSAGVVSSEDVQLAGTASASFETKNVGTAKPVAVTGYTLSGADSGNYTLAQPAGLTANIAPMALSITGVTANSKTYDGTTTATLSGTAALSTGVVSGEDVQLTGTASATFDTKNAGTAKPVTVTGYTLSGADIANYTLTQPAGLTADITAIALSVTGLTANNKPYDGTPTATLSGTAALSAGVLSGEDVTLTGTASAQFDNKNVGTAKPVSITGYTLAGADSANYTLAQPAGLTAEIMAIALSVTGVTANSKPYDGTATATLSGTAALSTGVLSGEDVTLIGTPSALFDNKNVGTAKPVTVTGYALLGTDSGNYTLAQPAGLTANITAIALSVTGVTASTKTYDGTATATLAGTAALSAGVVSGEDVSLGGTAAALFDNANVGTGKPVTVTGYTLTGADIANYTLAQPTGLTADITPAASVTALLSSLNPSTNGDSVTFTATVSSSAGTPIGNVVFLTNGVAMATVALSSGTASAATADLPVGTLTVRAEYAAQDNWQASADSLSQEVRSAVVLSTTNTVLSIVDNGAGLYTLNCLGTPDAQYYIVAASSPSAPMSSWTALVGSTNTATSLNGLWSFQVSNAAPAFYRSVAINPAH